MKKRKSIGLWVGICLLFLGIFGRDVYKRQSQRCLESATIPSRAV